MTFLRGGGRTSGNKQNKILIHQDITGNFHLFLYRKNGYFAVSNSLFKLIDYLSTRVELTLNREYAAHFLSISLTNHAYRQTIINEIEQLPKETYLEIDVDTKELALKKVRSVPDLSVPLDSVEGMRVLDAWQKKWVGIYRAIKDRTNKITVDLSGGFDTRIVFAIVLCSGIDLNDVRVNSTHDTLHTHAEDYAIASEIADHYGFTLNKPISQTRKFYKFERILEISFFTKIFEHKQMHFKHAWSDDENFAIGGKGGEALRGHWVMPPRDFMEQCVNSARRISKSLVNPTRKEIADTFDELIKEYHFSDPDDPYIMLELYRNARCRSHFGTEVVENFFSHTMVLSPLLDNSLRQLKLTDGDCQDADLLYALVFKRYCPELLNFKFDSGRSIAPATLEYAERLSTKYPMDDSEPEKCYLKVQKIVPDDEDFTSKPVKGNVRAYFNAYLKKAFLTEEVKKLFGMYFDEEVYDFAKADCEVKKYFPLSSVYPVIAVALAIAYCMRSRLDFSGIAGILDAFKLPERVKRINPLSSLLPLAEDIVTARIDIKNAGAGENDIEIVEMSDKDAVEITPAWFNKNGHGHVITSTAGKLDMRLRCNESGTLGIFLRAKDVRDANNKRVPLWAYYKNFTVDGENVFDTVHPVWHDAPYIFRKKVTDGETIALHVEWLADAKTAILMGNREIENRRKRIAALNDALKSQSAEIENVRSQAQDLQIKLNSASARLKESINPSKISRARVDVKNESADLNEILQRIEELNSKLDKANLVLEGQNKLIVQQEERAKKLQNKLKNVNARLKKERVLNAKLKEDVSNIRSGMSFRIGRVITYIPRKILGK